MALFESSGDALRHASKVFAELAGQLGSASDDQSLQVVAEVAAARVTEARWASITTVHGTEFRTSASTDETALRADKIQYEMGTGPCLDAIVDDTVYNPQDLRHDDRWPELGRRLADEVGIGSMLSFRLATDGEQMAGGLNLYSDRPHGFGDESVALGLLLATHAAAIVALRANRARAEGLQEALQSNRDIGVAIGVLMSAYKVTRDEAFNLLRIASQSSNRKLRDIALDVAETGALDLGAVRRESRRTAR